MGIINLEKMRVSEHQRAFVDWLCSTLVEAGTISASDLDLLTLTDDLDEVIAVIRSCVECHTPPPGHPAGTGPAAG